ncbi:DUF898 domain-containing protein [Stutzerimonas kirkiae]|uniref:DUF898 domain-containing protein n=1 Tax=Stutzerimonas kirkiae TaxID=2211392 RepID=A0A4Q9R0W0_9GAMM|nr:YjgN family protein [Stutzerimonas kirkiae]TBU91293.1 DUF898 domain-containing protein [Stutzerimonas kirkiae]TBV00437.1 DUF898 domain-containing protein [Stutzerimonas kirkiae]TBV15271.1 DUF898 domain-containing protein [Stutzerimonas kirkiae]
MSEAANSVPDTIHTEKTQRPLAFRFSGEGFEFFRIWIVNLALTIVTLGLYSPWAKVRTHRYFYGNTHLDGNSFEYLADPVRILKGRLIAIACLVVYVVAERLLPLLALALAAIFALLVPYIVVRAIAFHHYYSAWRGIRFGFNAPMGEAYKVFLLWPLLATLSLGLLFPYVLCRQERFIIGHSRYGKQHFDFSARPGAFYRVFLILIGIILLAGVAGGILSLLFAPLLVVAITAGYLLAFALGSVLLVNLRFNHMTLGEQGFHANYRAGSYAWLVLSNTLALLLTLGLFYPWARVRTARYAAGHIGMTVSGDLDEFVAARQQEQSALGSEMSDVFDVDLGL